MCVLLLPRHCTYLVSSNHFNFFACQIPLRSIFQAKKLKRRSLRSLLLLIGRRNGVIYKFVSIPFLPPTFCGKKYAGLFNSHHTFTVIALISKLCRQVYFSSNYFFSVPPFVIFFGFAKKKHIFGLILFH